MDFFKDINDLETGRNSLSKIERHLLGFHESAKSFFGKAVADFLSSELDYMLTKNGDQNAYTSDYSFCKVGDPETEELLAEMMRYGNGVQEEVTYNGVAYCIAYSCD
jgi:hypothetical protein